MKKKRLYGKLSLKIKDLSVLGDNAQNSIKGGATTDETPPATNDGTYCNTMCIGGTGCTECPTWTAPPGCQTEGCQSGDSHAVCCVISGNHPTCDTVNVHDSGPICASEPTNCFAHSCIC